MRIPFSELTLQGAVKDVHPSRLPPGMWSSVKNVRFTDNEAAAAKGQAYIVTQPSDTPRGITFIANGTVPFFVYGTPTKLWCFSGATHTDITRLSGAYTMADALKWNFANLGGVLIANNGVDKPQFWATPSSGTKMADLTNWPANTITKVVRAFKNYLVALHVTKTGTEYPHLVKWSHPADPGTVPSSWNEADATKDAGEYPLIETGDIVMDCLPLRDTNVIYKQATAWGMTPGNATFVFNFKKLFNNVGILAQDCVVDIGARHFVVTPEDVVIHDGVQVLPIVTNKWRRYIFNRIDPTYFNNCFCFFKQKTSEVFFCYPQIGSQYCTHAIVFNIVTGAITEQELASPSSGAAIGYEGSSSDTTWDTAVGDWDSDLVSWESGGLSIMTPMMLLAQPVSGKSGLSTIDVGLKTYTKVSGTITETEPVAELIREHIVFGQERMPELDSPETSKQITTVYPVVEATAGGYVDISIGVANSFNGSFSYAQTVRFFPDTMQKCDFNISGKYLGIKFSGPMKDQQWKLRGYSLDVNMVGRF